MTVSSFQPFPCAVCGRAGGHMVISISQRPAAHFCSIECGELWMKRGGELRQIERNAAMAGGEAAGAYLDSIGKTDLAQMTAQEWEAFCATLFKAATDDLHRQAVGDVPF